MYSVKCWRLRQVLTRYVDGELTPTEGVEVQQHLDNCRTCHQRVRVEQAVRQGLRERTVRAGSSAWLPRPEFPTRRAAFRWHVPTVALATALVTVLAFWGSRSFQAVPLEAVGLISDSHCNGVHHPAEAPDVDPPDCVQGCIKKGARYVVVADGTIYTIRNQDFPALAASAGRTVHITGTTRGDRVTLEHVAPVR